MRRLAACASACLALLAVAAAPSSAATARPGSLVTAFGGGDGTVTVPLARERADQYVAERALALAARTSGAGAGSFRLVDAFANDDSPGLAVRAYRSDGSVDPSFLVGRPFITGWMTPFDWGGRPALDAQQRLYLSSGAAGVIRVARYLASGAVDRTYQPPPWAPDGFGSDWPPGRSVLVLPTGGVWECAAPVSSGPRVALAYVEPSGALVREPIVDLGGIATFDDVCGELIGGPAGSFYLRAVLQLPDSSKREAVLRVLPTGALDPAFGSDGLGLLPQGFSSEPSELSADGPMRLVGGRLLLGGYTVRSGDIRPTVVALTADGRLDSSFGYGGVLRLAHAGTQITDVDADFRGGMLVALHGRNTYPDTSSSAPGLVRLTASGRPVRSFGSNGFLQLTTRPDTGPAVVQTFASGRMLIALDVRRWSKVAQTFVFAVKVEKRTVW